MAFGASLGNNNISVTSSFYQYYFVNSTGWNTSEGTTNRNVRNWIMAGSAGPYPAVDTNHSPSTNAAMSIPRNKDRLFWVNLEIASSTTIAAVFFESPFLVLDVSIPGWKSAGLSNNQNFLTINCTTNYPFPFTAWRVNSSSGTTGTTVQNPNIFFNSTYGGTSFENITAFYAI
tara:strand:- start:4953 stop:5474 length:522 start_codon:yes stop_codon:yes gene_type:complete